MAIRFTVAPAAAFLFGLTFRVEAEPPELTIPEPLRVEHHEIYAALDDATRVGGATGSAAERAMTVLRPHFEKEERFALPQLGALETLTRQGATLSPELQADLIARTESLRAELPVMLEEHRRISAALREMRQAAQSEQRSDIAELAGKIMAHAGMEEEILYPAALLVGGYAEALGGPATGAK